MRLFDRLILADGIAKVVDVGHLAFQRFFSVMDQIGFAEEAQRRSLEVIVLYAADAHPTSVKAYDILQRRLPSLILVPVFNEASSRAASCATSIRSRAPPRCRCRFRCCRRR